MKRSDGQTLLTVAVDQNLLAAIDSKRGFENRSAFVRRVICEHLKIDLSLSAAPDRIGKGGKPTHARKAKENDLPQVAEGGRAPARSLAVKSISPRKSKLKPVPGTGSPDEKASIA